MASPWCIREPKHADGMEPDKAFCVCCAKEVEDEAGDLRSRLVIQPSGPGTRLEEMWNHDDLQGNGKYFANGRGEDFAPFFGPSLGLRRGSIEGNGLCQYKSFCLPAFGGHMEAITLQHLAVKYLRVYKSAYMESMSVYITDEDGGERYDALTRLMNDGKITRLGYDGYMDALDLPVGDGVEFGQHLTLNALSVMLRLRVRLLVRTPWPLTLNADPGRSSPHSNLTLCFRMGVAQINRCPTETGLQLIKYPNDPSPTLGAAVPLAGTIYMTQSLTHYTDIEEMVLESPTKPTPLPSGGEPEEWSTAMSEYEQVHTMVGGHEGLVMGYTLGELYEGVPDPDENRQLLRLISNGEGEARLWRLDLKSDSMHLASEIVIREPRREAGWKHLRSKDEVIAKRRAGKEQKALKASQQQEAAREAAMLNRAELEVDTLQYWAQELSPHLFDKQGRNLRLLADKIFEAMRHWRARLAGSAVDQSALDTELRKYQTAIQKLQFEHFAPKKSIEPRVIVIGTEGVGKSTTVNHIMQHAMKTSEQLTSAGSIDRSDDDFRREVVERLNKWKVDMRAHNVFMDTISSERAEEMKLEIEEQLRCEWGQPGAGTSGGAVAAAAGGASSSTDAMDTDDEVRMTVKLSRRFVHEKDVPLDAICEVEKTILSNLTAAGIYDEGRDDILPTSGKRSAATALITKIRLDPTARNITLRLRYHEQREIESVLENAQTIQKYLIDIKQASEDAEAEVEDLQLTNAYGKPVSKEFEIHRACALLGITTVKGNGDDMLELYKGSFKLPSRFDQLLGRERLITIEGSDPDAMLAKLAQQLLLHTFDWSNRKLWTDNEQQLQSGEFSHWATVQSVEITIPSQSADLSVWDVPGFGDIQTDPYRQMVITEALESPASVLLMCHGPIRESYDAGTRKPLRDHGILLELLGDMKESRIGCLAAVSSIDWILKDEIDEMEKAMLKAQLNPKAKKKKDIGPQTLERPAQLETRNAMESMQQEMKVMLEQALPEAKGTAAAHQKHKVDEVVRTYCHQYVVDVKGALPEEAKRDTKAKSMDKFIKSLQHKCDEDRIRRQERFVLVLMSTVLFPFYQLTLRTSQLAELSDETRKYMESNVPKLKPMLQGVKAMINPEGDFSNTPQMRAKEFRDIMDPVVKRCTPDAVDAIWFGPEFYAWRQKGARKLGLALSSTDPHTTLLRKLVSGPLAGDLPALLVAIAQKLDEMEVDIKKPLDNLSDEMLQIFRSFGRGASGGNSSDFLQLEINALLKLMQREFQVAKAAMLETFRQDFAKHKSELRYKFDAILQNEMVNAPGRSPDQRFHAIYKNRPSSNIKRKDSLKSISYKLNQHLANSLEVLITNIFKSIVRFFEAHFSNVVTVVHQLLSGTKTLKGTEADDALGIAASEQYSRFCAVLIAALRDAARRQDPDLEFIRCIIIEQGKDLMDGVDKQVAASPASRLSLRASTSQHSTLMEAVLLLIQAEQDGEEEAGAPRKKQRVETKVMTWKQLIANKDFCAHLSQILKHAGDKPRKITSITDKNGVAMIEQLLQAAREVGIDNDTLAAALQDAKSVKTIVDFMNSMVAGAPGSSQGPMIAELDE